MRTIIVALDLSDATHDVVAHAKKLARAFSAKLHLVHVAAGDPLIADSRSWPQEVRDQLAQELVSEREVLHTLADELTAEGIEAKALLLRGDAAKLIQEKAEQAEADLIVLGSRHSSKLMDMLPVGVTARVVRHATCPVMVVPVQEQVEAASDDTEAEAS